MHPPSEFKIDKNRDATDSIRGYVYQIYQSVLAWMVLKEDEILVLEGAEDFDVHSDSSVITTQIKDVANNLTFRSKSIVDSLNNFWSHCEKNSDCNIYFHFLTTAEAGQEQGDPFGSDKKGLDCWNIAAAGSIDVEPFRTLLATLNLTDNLAAFVKKATNEEFLEKLIKRIKWNLGNKPRDALQITIEDRLKIHGSRLGINTYDSCNALSYLIKNTADLLSTKGQKQLKYADFLSAFDEATRVSISRSELEVMIRANNSQQPSELVRLANRAPPIGTPLPIVDGGIARVAVTSNLIKLINEQRVIFLCGSSGLGKTNLASLIAHKIGGSWGWTGFRNAIPEQIRDTLTRAAYEINASILPPYLVLDDIDLKQIIHFEREFISLVFAIIHANGMVVITGPTNPPLQLLPKIWKSEVSEVIVPYFDEAEIAEMIRAHELSDDRHVSIWTKTIFVTTSGHPQLVHARVRTLSAKGWPQNQWTDLFKPDDVERVKLEARDRLFQEFPSENARVLAYRLSLMHGSFSRETAMAVADAPPPTKLPGETFDALVGPWVEREGNNRFRISPLLTGAANDIFTKDDIKVIHGAVARGIISSKSLNQFEVSTAFFHAYMARDIGVLLKMAYAIISTESENIHYLNDAMSWFSLISLGSGEKILSENNSVDFMLRLAQYKMITSSSNTENAIAVIDKIEEALSSIEPIESRRVSEAMAYGVILNTVEFHIPSAIVIRMLSSMIDVVDEGSALADGALADVAGALQAIGNGLPFMAENTPAQILFSYQAVRLSGLDDLYELIGSLDHLPAYKREQLLKVFDANFSSLLIGQSWWKEVKGGVLDVEKALKVLKFSEMKSREWKLPELTKACLVATSVVQDEYGKLMEDALLTLDAADNEFPEDAFLINQRAKVLFHADRNAEAMPLAKKSILLPGLSDVDYVFCCRSAGIAAAKLGDWLDSENLFKQGFKKAIDSDIQKNMGIGLKADAAFALWKQKKYRESIILFADVLDLLAEILDPKGIRSHHLQVTIRHCIAWISFDAAGEHLEDLVEPIPGMCSNQDPHEKIEDHKIININAAWGFLAGIDSFLDLNAGVIARMKAATKEKMPLNMVINERIKAVDYIFIKKEFNNLVPALINMIEALLQVKKNNSQQIDGWEVGDIPKLESDDFDLIGGQDIICHHILMASLICITDDRSAPLAIDAWRADLINAGALSENIADFLNALSGKTADNTLYQKAGSNLLELKNGAVLPAKLWGASFRLLDAFKSRPKLVDKAMERLFLPRWDYAINHQKFAFITPTLACRDIERCCRDRSLSGLSKVAAVLNVSEPYVDIDVSPEAKKMINEIIERGRLTLAEE